MKEIREKHYAEATRREDLAQGVNARGAVHIRSQTLTGDVEWPEAFQPRFPCRGLFWVPDVGEQLEVDVGDSEHPDPRITDFVYSSDDDIDALFKENYPHRRGWVSPSGSYMIFDDKPGVEAVLFFHRSGTGHEWHANGDELKTVVGKLQEEIQGAVERSMHDALTESVAGDVKKTWAADLIFELGKDGRFTFKGDVRAKGKNITLEFTGAWKLKIVKFAVSNGSGELIDKLEKKVGAFVDNATTMGLSTIGPVELSPVIVDVLKDVRDFLNAIKV